LDWRDAAKYAKEKFATKCTLEDWEESFTSYVYPNYWSFPLISGGIRETFIKDKINELP